MPRCIRSFKSDTSTETSIPFSEVIYSWRLGRSERKLSDFVSISNLSLQAIGSEYKELDHNIAIMARTTYYDVLEISKDAKLIDIKKAYRRLALK